MSIAITMPKQGFLREWRKKVGDTVHAGEPLFCVAIGKLLVNVESEVSGVLRELTVEAGGEVPLGTIIGYIDECEIPEEEFSIEKSSKKSVVVIGGGPGGYSCAVRLAQLGADVVLIEKNALGGTCLNVGCIPTKALAQAAEVLRTARSAGVFGVNVENVSFDWGAVMKRKDDVIAQLLVGVQSLVRGHGVKIVRGEARVVSRNEVWVGDEKFSPDSVVIATGSEPITGDATITSTDALSMKNLPESIVIVGGGAIGIEFADIFSAFGVKVDVIEMAGEILPAIDSELAGLLREKMSREGRVGFHLASKVTALRETTNGVSVSVQTPNGQISISAEKALLSVGRKTKKISVNEYLETENPGIYAIGDCASPIMLAHVAAAEGEIAAQNIMEGNTRKIDYKVVPSCVYTSPEIAAIGLTERAAREQGRNLKIGKFPLSANGKCLVMNAPEGFVKLVIDAKTDAILGVHIIGKHAADLISEGALALKLGATAREIAETIHPHPTVSEAIAEAARFC